MITKNDIKLVRSLRLKKYRDETGLFVAEGRKCIEELIAESADADCGFECVLHIDSTNATARDIAQMTNLQTPQGELAIFRQAPKTLPSIASVANELILLLDEVQDPGNLGTIIRTADWFGVRHVICSANTADCYSPKVVQATMGALARVKVSYAHLPTFLRQYLSEQSKNRVFGTFMDGKSIYATALPRQGILLMGNEGQGISAEVAALVTDRLLIPSYPVNGKTVESLNVAIATAIALSEFRR